MKKIRILVLSVATFCMLACSTLQTFDNPSATLINKLRVGDQVQIETVAGSNLSFKIAAKDGSALYSHDGIKVMYNEIRQLKVNVASEKGLGTYLLEGVGMVLLAPVLILLGAWCLLGGCSLN